MYYIIQYKIYSVKKTYLTFMQIVYKKTYLTFMWIVHIILIANKKNFSKHRSKLNHF